MAAFEPKLMTVKTDLVKDLLVGRIHAIVVERHDQPLPIETEGALNRHVTEMISEEPSQLDSDLATKLARAGYLARVAEQSYSSPPANQEPRCANCCPSKPITAEQTTT